MAIILKTDFIDHTKEMKLYKAGADISHLSADKIAYLETGGHIEQTEEKTKSEKAGKTKK